MTAAGPELDRCDANGETRGLSSDHARYGTPTVPVEGSVRTLISSRADTRQLPALEYDAVARILAELS